MNAAGAVSISEDKGASWRPLGQIGGQPTAFAAHTERDLYAALPDRTVKQSTGSGRSWTVRSAP